MMGLMFLTFSIQAEKKLYVVLYTTDIMGIGIGRNNIQWNLSLRPPEK